MRRRVDAYFEQTGKHTRDCPSMYLKTALILGGTVATYLLLMFVATNWWLVVPLAIVMGCLIAAIGFNIQHDAGHRAYSDKQWVNKLMSMTLDLCGGSSYIWDWKHNSIHHTYPNIAGHDDDINIGLLGRLAPQQKRIWFHRFQCIYLWLLYGFLAVKWHFVDDFFQVAKGRIGEHKIRRPHGKELAIFIGGKIAFFSLAFVIPMLRHPAWAVISVYLMAAITSGIVLSVVFQLAHCVEDAEFPEPISTPDGERMETDWALHQVQTTVNFSRRNPVLRWFLGGLNFQIEHHLFSRICHIHYPDLSKIVEDVCHEFGVQYQAHKSFFSALASHYRWLVEMGRPVVS
ncbi:MAG TPA: acyl-CoA desaturase [Tepidisphaeraceae bacterium]|nr:acyl-CoA desaturase [Tepidisphaeraceae bacterium]